MRFASTVLFLSLFLVLALPLSVNMPTAAIVPLFSVIMPTVVISVLVRTSASVLRQTLIAAFLSVFVQTSVPAFGPTTAPPLVSVRAFTLPFRNLTKSLDPSATTSPMVLYTGGSRVLAIGKELSGENVVYWGNDSMFW